MKLPRIKDLVISKLAQWSQSLLNWSVKKAQKKVQKHETKLLNSGEA